MRVRWPTAASCLAMPLISMYTRASPSLRPCSPSKIRTCILQCWDWFFWRETLLPSGARSTSGALRKSCCLSALRPQRRLPRRRWPCPVRRPSACTRAFPPLGLLKGDACVLHGSWRAVLTSNRHPLHFLHGLSSRGPPFGLEASVATAGAPSVPAKQFCQLALGAADARTCSAYEWLHQLLVNLLPAGWTPWPGSDFGPTWHWSKTSDSDRRSQATVGHGVT